MSASILALLVGGALVPAHSAYAAAPVVTPPSHVAPQKASRQPESASPAPVQDKASRSKDGNSSENDNKNDAKNDTKEDDNLTGWGTPEEQPGADKTAQEPMMSVHIKDIPLKLTVTRFMPDGATTNLVDQTAMTGNEIGLDAEHPTLLSYHAPVAVADSDYAQDVSPSEGLVFGLPEFSRRQVQPLEDAMIASLPPDMPNVPTRKTASMLGYRVDVTPRAVLHDGKPVPSTPDGTSYQDGDIVQADVAFLTYRPFGKGIKATLPASKGKYGALQVTIPALSYAVTAQKVTLALGETQKVEMENPVTHTKFLLTLTVLPKSALPTLRLKKDGSM